MRNSKEKNYISRTFSRCSLLIGHAEREKTLFSELSKFSIPDQNISSLISYCK